MADKGNIVREHFWFTATTIAVNAFIMSAGLQPLQILWARIFSTVISGFAVFLIVHRSAAHADKLRYPDYLDQIPESEKQFWHKARQTWCHFKLFPKHVPFVICEFGGALFYLLLVVASCVGVWLAT